MSKPDIPREPERLSCDVCCREIPLSEDKSQEAVDYVLHFCGAECYAQWRGQATAGERQPGERPRLNVPAIELSVVWQRLVAENGSTCERCDATRQELQRALDTLEDVLRPLGVKAVLHTRDMDMTSFRLRPTESNRVWIDGTPLEAWLGAEVGRSRCCAVCGHAECRTLEVGGHVYEAVPDVLIVKAALMAAARLLMPSAPQPAAAVPF